MGGELGAWRWSTIKLFRIAERNGLSNRFLNGAKCAVSVYFLGHRPIRTANGPIFAQVEITNKCNLRCIMCKRYSMFGEGRHMPFDDFKLILEKIPTVTQIHFQGYGEPLLNPQMPDMVSYAREKKLWTSTSTNGLLLSPEKSLSLMEAGLDEIGISVDGSTAKTYQKIRGVNIREVEKNTKRFLKFRNEHGYKTKAWLLGVVMRENIEELPGIVDLAAEWGFDGVVMQHVTHSVEDVPENFGRSVTEDSFDGEKMLIQEAIDRAKSHGLVHVIHSLDYDKGLNCYWPWSGLYINVDGNVSLCSVTYNPVVGNLIKQDFSQVWNSKVMREWRSKLRNHICKGCKFHYYNKQYVI